MKLYHSLAAASMVALTAYSGGARAVAGTPPAASAQPVSSRDREWLRTAHQANLAEIKVGELAKRKGNSAAIRSAGKMLVADHTDFDDEVTDVADDLDVKLPGSASPADADAAERLGNESGAKFDHDFASVMMTGHQRLIHETREEIAHGSAPQVRNLAREALPTLRKHLAMLRKAAPTG